jgi:ATP-binding cassette subfamily B protein
MAMLPIVMLYVSKLIIDQVVLLSKSGNENISLTPLWQLIALEFGMVILASALSMAIKLIDTLLGDLFANHSLIKIMSHAATLDLDQFEDSLFYDKLERARQQSSGRVALLTHVLTQVQDLITMCFFGATLIVFNPWFTLILIFSTIPSFIGEYYFNIKNYIMTRRQMHGKRELEYLSYVGASDQSAKEVRLFDLSGLKKLIKKLNARIHNNYKANDSLEIFKKSENLFKAAAYRNYNIKYYDKDIVAFFVKEHYYYTDKDNNVIFGKTTFNDETDNLWKKYARSVTKYMIDGVHNSIFDPKHCEKFVKILQDHLDMSNSD